MLATLSDFVDLLRQSGTGNRVDLLPGAERGDEQPRHRFVAGLRILFCARSGGYRVFSLGQHGSQPANRAAEFVVTKDKWLTPVNAGSHRMIAVRYLPCHLAVGRLLHVLLAETGDLLIAVEHRTNLGVAPILI